MSFILTDNTVFFYFNIFNVVLYSEENMDRTLSDGVSTDAVMNIHTLLLIEVTFNVKLRLCKWPHYKIPQKRQNYKLLSILHPKLQCSEDMKTFVTEVTKSFADSCSFVECQFWNNDCEEKGKLGCPTFPEFIKSFSL